MTDNDFEFKGKQFKLNKIDALDQYHIVRLMAPMLAELVPIVGKLKGKKTKEFTDDDFASLAPLITGFSKLSRKDSEEVLFGLLSGVEMKQEKNWARLATVDGLMFQNLELPVLLQAAGRSFWFNLKGFLGESLDASPVAR